MLSKTGKSVTTLTCYYTFEKKKVLCVGFLGVGGGDGGVGVNWGEGGGVGVFLFLSEIVTHLTYSVLIPSLSAGNQIIKYIL